MIVTFTLTTDELRDKNSRIEQLLAFISSGDTTSMGDLYELIKTDVYAFALSKTRNKSDADDITQDTFVQIYRYAKQYHPKGKPMAWILRIELNLIRRHFQLHARNAENSEIFENSLVSENFESSTIDNLFLRALLKTLNEEEREVVVLHVVSGLKHREIAKLLDKPLSTVLSKYNRAIKKLQAIVKEEFYEKSFKR